MTTNEVVITYISSASDAFSDLNLIEVTDLHIRRKLIVLVIIRGEYNITTFYWKFRFSNRINFYFFKHKI